MLLSKVDKRDLGVTLALGQLALARNEYSMARRYFTEALAMRPGTVQIIEQLLQIDMLEHNEQGAQTHIRHILNMDPDNAMANYALGSLQIKNKDYALAVDSLQRSATRRESPVVLNDLAWALCKQGRLDDALRYSMKSLGIDKNSAVAWDTMGVILTGMNRFDKARVAIDKAAALAPKNLEIQVHSAVLLDKMGQSAEAAKLIAVLLADKESLPEDSRTALLKIQSRGK